MIADIRRIVASGASAVDYLSIDHVIEPGDAFNGNVQRVEQSLAPGDGFSRIAVLVTLRAVEISPLLEQQHGFGIECFARWIQTQRIVDTEEKLLRHETLRPTIAALSIKISGRIIF